MSPKTSSLHTLSPIDKIHHLVELSQTEDNTQESTLYAQEAIRIITQYENTLRNNDIGDLALSAVDSTDLFDEAKKYFGSNSSVLMKMKANALYQLMENHRARGNYTEAISEAEHALVLFEELHDKVSIAQTLLRCTQLYIIQESLGSLQEYLDRLTAIAESFDDVHVVTNTLIDAAKLFEKHDCTSEALHNYEAVLTILEGHFPHEALPLRITIGLLYVQKKRFAKAYAMFKQGLKLSEDNKLLQGNFHSGLSRVFFALGDYNKAAEWTTKAITCYESAEQNHDTQVGKLHCEILQAEILYEQNNILESLECISQALQIAQDIQASATDSSWEKHTEAVLFAAAKISLATGEVDTTMDYLQQITSTTSTISTLRAYATITECQMAMKYYSESQKTIDSMQEILSTDGRTLPTSVRDYWTAKTTMLIATLHITPDSPVFDVDRTILLLHQALHIGQKVFSSAELDTLHETLSRSYEIKGETENILYHLEQSYTLRLKHTEHEAEQRLIGWQEISQSEV
jgi:tetratricopeptide (TPR) repeat protein